MVKPKKSVQKTMTTIRLYRQVTAKIQHASIAERSCGSVLQCLHALFSYHITRKYLKLHFSKFGFLRFHCTCICRSAEGRADRLSEVRPGHQCCGPWTATAATSAPARNTGTRLWAGKSQVRTSPIQPWLRLESPFKNQVYPD